MTRRLEKPHQYRSSWASRLVTLQFLAPVSSAATAMPNPSRPYAIRRNRRRSEDIRKIRRSTAGPRDL